MPQTPEVVFSPILPELIVAGAAIAILLADAIRPIRDQRVLAFLALVALGAGAWATLRLWGPFAFDPAQPERLTVLGGMVAADRYALFFRLVILGSSAVAVLLASTYLRRTGEGRGEFFSLLLFATAGMTLLAASADLIMVFLSLEVLSLSLYVMAGFSLRRLASQEASLKYFLLGSFSSAFFLYGVALAYGAAGPPSLAGMAGGVSGGAATGLAIAAAALLLIGFAFKVAAVPFHMWTPDVYQGAPTPVTAFMAAGTKVAGFAALMRVTQVALGGLGWDLQPVLYAVAIVTMVVGSLVAIAQSDVKRMLAYSSIAHAGFILVGVTAGNQEGISGGMFYLVAYAAMIMGAFGVVMLVSRRGEGRTSLDSYRGLGRTNPGLAGLLALFLLSLAGIPPLAGFWGKVFVFEAAIAAGLWPLVVIGVLASVVAAFFYIQVLVLAYMQDPVEAEAVAEPAAAPAVALIATAAVTVVFGFFPGLILGPLGEAAVLHWVP
ncbi:MAG TPA: NADH-quinone oxidoreductase subunit N [Actinomycetota bacterium]|nr:NADH-quinone oxidoreductase subunit N [Actinomycetota bacterium]